MLSVSEGVRVELRAFGKVLRRRGVGTRFELGEDE